MGISVLFDILLPIWGIDVVLDWERKATQYSDTYWLLITYNIIYTIYVLAGEMSGQGMLSRVLQK